MFVNVWHILFGTPINGGDREVPSLHTMPAAFQLVSVNCLSLIGRNLAFEVGAGVQRHGKDEI